MKKVIVIVLALAAVMLALPISTAYATGCMSVNAILQMMGPPTYEKQIALGNIEIVSGTAPFWWGWTPTGMVGDIQGSAICHFVWIFYEDGSVTGISVHKIESAIVTVGENTLTGSLTILITIKKGWIGRWIVLRGTGDLENLHGGGTWEANLATPNNPYDYLYSGTFRLRP